MSARDDYPRLAAWIDGATTSSQFDHQLVAALDEIDRLRHWKSEATTVIEWWEDVWRALGEPGRLGDTRSKACVAEINRRRADHDRLIGEVSAAAVHLTLALLPALGTSNPGGAE